MKTRTESKSSQMALSYARMKLQQSLSGVRSSILPNIGASAGAEGSSATCNVQTYARLHSSCDRSQLQGLAQMKLNEKS
jgi:hypothetical protein